jgi:hypothetical protein
VRAWGRLKPAHDNEDRPARGRTPTSRSSAAVSVLEVLRRIRAIGVIALYTDLFLGHPLHSVAATRTTGVS